MAESLGDFQVARMLARVPVPYDRQDALDWLAADVGADPRMDAAITNGDDVHIGCVGIELRHGQWHLGYWLNRYYWGTALASEAAYAAIERFFRAHAGDRLHSGVFADNPGSLKLQEKLGFPITGCARSMRSPAIPWSPYRNQAQRGGSARATLKSSFPREACLRGGFHHSSLKPIGR